MATRRGASWALTAVCTAALLVLPVAAGAHAKPRHAKAHAHTAIVGGTTASTGTFPWLAYIQYDEGNGTFEHCTGTVVSSNVVLTAGHCAVDIVSNTINAATGFLVATGSVDPIDAPGQVSAVSQVIPFPYFDPATTGLYGDAALLVLTTPTTAPALALATPLDAYLTNPGGVIAIAGWGLTSGGDTVQPNTLQWATTAAQSSGYCTTQDANDGLPFYAVSTFCAIDPPGYATGTCKGDSGGPAIAAPTSSTLVEVGITSYGDPNCSTTAPSNFTSTQLVGPWVNVEIAAFAPPPPPPPPPPVVVVPPPPAATTTAPAPTTPAAPAALTEGRFAGASGQRSGNVNLTVGANGVTRLRFRFNLHCSRGKHTRGPFVTTWVDATSPFQLVAANGAWTFTALYNDTTGGHYTVTGTFPTTSSATGTLSVHERTCSTGLVHWAASLP